MADSSRARSASGVLTIEWAGEGAPVFMTGPAETVYAGTIDLPEALG